MKLIRRLVEADARLMRWLTDRLGLWRIDVAICRRREAEMTRLARELDAQGLSGSAVACRESAARWRDWGEQRIPARCRP